MQFPLRLLPSAALTTILLAGLACGGLGGPYSDADLVGTWVEEGGALTVIERQGGELRVTSIVDSDGEVFEVQSSGWESGLFSWTYLVPSTSYVVDIDVISADGGTMFTTWSNQYDAGTEELVRLN